MKRESKRAWSLLPNAKHIDRIVACLRDHPGVFHRQIRRGGGGTLSECSTAFTAAFIAMRDAQQPIRNKAWLDAQRTLFTRKPAEYIAWDAIAALIAWDHAGDLLKLPAEQVHVLGLLGNNTALLLYPTILAMGLARNVSKFDDYELVDH